MLDDQQILSDIHALPPEKQSEILNFIAFVKSRDQRVSTANNEPPITFQLSPASRPSGFTNTSVDHDAIFAQAIQDYKA